jgi:hypothetical protein
MENPIILWDLTETIGSTALDCSAAALAAFDPYDDARDLLRELAAAGARMGVLASGENWTTASIEAALRTTGIVGWFDPDLLQTWSTPSLQDHAPDSCVYVSRARHYRAQAQQQQMRCVPHRALVKEVMRREALQYVRIAAPNARADETFQVLKVLPIVPALATSEGSRVLYALTSATAAESIRRLGYEVQELIGGEKAEVVDLYLIHDCMDDSPASKRFRSRVKREAWAVRETVDGLLVAIGPEQSIDDFHPPLGRHGHTLELQLSRSFFTPPRPRPAIDSEELDEPSKKALRAFFDDQKKVIHNLAPWCTGAVRSRHVEHEDNRRAVREIAARLEQILGMNAVRCLPYPYLKTQLYNVEGTLAGHGRGAELVIVAAHLDSTARSNDTTYHAATDGAPGADDDASGIAAVLSAAEVLKSLASEQKPARSIRFVLLNGEEVGFSGSSTYAENLRQLENKGEVHVAAVLDADMIGYIANGNYPSKDAKSRFEVHTAGRDDFKNGVPEDALAKANELAKTLAGLVADLAPDLVTQIYPLPGCASDPASANFGRSDHFVFLRKGMPACVVSEDFFADTCGGAGDNNPYYHKASDQMQHLKPRYLAGIACVVAATAWLLANPMQPNPAKGGAR